MFEEYYDSTWLAGAQKRLKEEIPELDQLLKAQYHKKKTITPELCQDQRDFFDSTAAYERYLLVVATKIAMLDIYDFKFGVDIAAAQSNIERTQANAEDIFKYLNRDIMKAYKGLDERLQLIARLNWLSILYRMVHDIAKIRGAVHDQKTLLFFRKLNLKENWDKAAGAYRAAENAAKEDVKQPSFDQWMTDFEKTVIEPEEALWKREEIRGAAIRRTKRAVQIVVLCVVSYVIISYAAGFGYVARMLHHLRPEVVTNTADIDGFGTFPPADIADYNASSIKDKGNPLYTDRNLMDGDTTTSWTEGEDDAGINRRMYFNIEKKATVNYIVIWNGDQSSEENFRAHNRLKQVTLKINDTRHMYTMTLADTMGPQYIRVEREDVDRLWIIIDSVYEGDNGEDETSVSEVEIY